MSPANGASHPVTIILRRTSREFRGNAQGQNGVYTCGWREPHTDTQEARMTRSAIRLVILTMFSDGAVRRVLGRSGAGRRRRRRSDPSAAPAAARHQVGARRPHHPKTQEEAQQAVQRRGPGLCQRLPRGLCDDLRPQRLCRGHRAAQGARPRRPRQRRQSDRLFLSQARRLPALADLVRARPESRPEPCADLAVLRPVADRTGQPRPGAISSEPDRRDLRHGLRGVPVTGRGAGKGAGHRSRVLNSAMHALRARLPRRARICLIHIDGYRQPGDSNI